MKSLKLLSLACLVSSLWLTMAGVDGSSSADDVSCRACAVPPPESIPFCDEFVHYSSCKMQSSWKEMDTTAKQSLSDLIQEAQLVNRSISAECRKATKKAICLKQFSACENGTPVFFCYGSCQQAIMANCTLAVNVTSTMARFVCGANDTPAIGVSTEATQCIGLDYAGVQHKAWIAGFAIAVTFSFLASVGINMQKKALKQNEISAIDQNCDPLPVYKLPLWVAGFVLIFVGSILDFVAFGLAPQSLLAPLAALTLVWNMMLAPCFNKEKLSNKDIAATLVIFTGATIAVVFANHSSPSYTLDMLLELYKNPLTCAYFVLVACVIAFHYLLIKFVEHLSLTSRRHRMIQLGRPSFWSRMRLIGYAGLAGTMGGQSVLFAKSMAELTKSLIHGHNPLGHFQTYMILIGLISCLLCQVNFLNRALAYFDALSVVPIYQAYWIISGVMGGAIYFEEIRSFTIEQACFFVLGIAMTITGVGLLTQRKPGSMSSRRLKRKYTTERSISGLGIDVIKPAAPADIKEKVDEPRDRPEQMATIREAEAEADTETENELSTAEESDEDAVIDDVAAGDQVNRHVIDNYLDMSPSICISELLGGLGYNANHTAAQLGIFTRRPSNRFLNYNAGAQERRSTVDDFEVGLQPSREDRPRDASKRRSITFTVFSNRFSSRSASRLQQQQEQQQRRLQQQEQQSDQQLQQLEQQSLSSSSLPPLAPPAPSSSSSSGDRSLPAPSDTTTSTVDASTDENDSTIPLNKQSSRSI